MRFFTVLDFQRTILALTLGAILLIAIYLTWKGYPRDRDHLDDPAREANIDFIPASEHHPVTPLLLFLYVAVALWVVGYLVVIGIFGGPVV
jgi:hypothetical protein